MNIAGDRMASLSNSKLKGEGRGIDWLGIGPYNMIFQEDGFATSVEHRRSGDTAAVSSHDPIYMSMSICKVWSDYAAYVDRKSSQLKLANLFDSGKGPHRRNVVTGSADIMLKAHGKAKEGQSQIHQQLGKSSSSSGEGFMTGHKKQQQRQLITKARHALELKQKDLVSKRTLSLASVAQKKQ